MDPNAIIVRTFLKQEIIRKLYTEGVRTGLSYRSATVINLVYNYFKVGPNHVPWFLEWVHNITQELP